MRLIHTCPSERLFSLAGHNSNNNHSNLLPENVNKLVFLAKNMYKLLIELFFACFLVFFFHNCVLSTLDFLNTHFVLLCGYVYVLGFLKIQTWQ